MEQKIVFLDVDGTLTLPNGEVSDNVKNLFNRYAKMVIMFFCAQAEIRQEFNP